MALASLISVLLAAQVPSLAALEQQYAELNKGGHIAHNDPRLETIEAGVILLIDADQLKSADEFRRAAMLITDSAFQFSESRVRHELMLAATALGDKLAQTQLAATWDALQLSLGREQRFNSFAFGMSDGPGEKFYPNPAPQVIQAVFKDPAAVGAASAKHSEHKVLKETVDADQRARQGDWSKFTVADFDKMAREDRARAKKVMDLIKSGAPKTGADFYAASLVLQHGSSYASYALAHELAICAMLLGEKGGVWLAAATYDRMLGSCGHKQRFATQYFNNRLSPVDESGISDSQRKALRAPTLEQARNRKIG